MGLTFADLFAPVRDLGVGDALEDWRWLTGDEARPLALTALGNLFCELADGQVAFLDTYEGAFAVVEPDRQHWKQSVQDPDKYGDCLLPGLVEILRERGLVLSEGQCYSPRQPLILGGQIEPGNFEVTSWRVHLGIVGQIHEQLRDVPPGTPINRVEIE